MLVSFNLSYILARVLFIQVITKPKTNVADLFRNARESGTYLKICAPMVRYSK